MVADPDSDGPADPSNDTKVSDDAGTDEQGKHVEAEADENKRIDSTAKVDEVRDEDVDTGESTDPDAHDDGNELTPANVELPNIISGSKLSIASLKDACDAWSSIRPEAEESKSREAKRNLTPDEVEIDRPDEFEFQYIPTEDLPSGVQYTPDFDPDWVYPSGSNDGGRQDDTPVQGLEIGVIGTEDTIGATVRSVLEAVSLYYKDTGQYPRHRVIKSAKVFNQIATDGVGLVAVLQPSPDKYDGLMDHMQALQSSDESAVNSNVQTTRRLVQYLGAQLVADKLGEQAQELDVLATTGWETGSQIGTLPIVERYAPLGAGEVYDPAIEELDLTEDGVASIADAGLTPQRLSIETNAELFTESTEINK